MAGKRQDPCRGIGREPKNVDQQIGGKACRRVKRRSQRRMEMSERGLSDAEVARKFVAHSDATRHMVVRFRLIRSCAVRDFVENGGGQEIALNRYRIERGA